MATDDEIREEVSSIGMASETIRPLYRHPDPFVWKPHRDIPRIREGYHDEAKDDAEIVRHQSSADEHPSTLTGSSQSSSLSSGPRADKLRKKPQKKSRQKGAAGVPEINKSSSSSSRSKKRWKGWQKTLGKVKQIVMEIDEQRIPQPMLHG
jgi:hypothetical protein